MTQNLEGSPSALRRLITGTLLPQLRLEAGRKERTILIAESTQPMRGRMAVESHHFPELCICIDGEAEIMCGSDVRALRQSDILVIPPGLAHSVPEAHCITLNPAMASSRLMWVRAFPYGAVINLCRTHRGVHHSTVHQVFLHRRIYVTVERLIEELHDPQFGHEQMAAGYAAEALLWICRGADIGSIELPHTNPPHLPAGKECLPVRTARFIQEGFDSQLNLDVIARALGASKSQICKEFRGHYNITVMDHVTRVRIEASKRLLQARVRVADVAQFVGFTDPYHFSRVFKKVTGQSPKQFGDAQRSAQGPVN